MLKHLSLLAAFSGLCLSATPAFSATALFAGGCFWSVEVAFDKVEGVTQTISGFAGGHLENPTYNEVAYGRNSGHYETVQVSYDPDVVNYEQLLTVFWHATDPTDVGGQFCDRGSTYSNAIFALDDEQAQLARDSMAALSEQSGYTIVTEIREAAPFWPAEAEHQNFYLTNPERYEAYRIACGRDARVAQLWGERAFLGTSDNPFPQ